MGRLILADQRALGDQRATDASADRGANARIFQIELRARDVGLARGDVRFRLAGERVAALSGRPLRGESLLSLWAAEHRGRLSRLLTSALATPEPLVVLASARPADASAADAQAEGVELRFEWMFAPLAGPYGALDRFLGLCQPEPGPSARAGALRIVAVNGVADAARRAPLRLAALDGRRIA